MLLPFRLSAPLALIALALFAGAASASVHVTTFQTPSHRILCGYERGDDDPAHIRCDLRFLAGRAAYLWPTGKAFIDGANDVIADPHTAPVLAYGHSRRFGQFRCTSRTTGLTCINRTDHHGFTVSREHRRMF
ncbi:hypothetical protein OM076_02285 [Solirubrobacter ginsenosidimutans]|uniref:Secreted protein n=1 Tax=Solirubrobacter ginsenosidimutans TaxID=490573 RepID=A0A9X3MPX6_9ACTN|nr:DUF6636 domain-containing protein [Solirubrobacter ginsenosidimutans]MDA0159080.1 hypothetical protein [Solirubrobacter ginsenosidimutans]